MWYLLQMNNTHTGTQHELDQPRNSQHQENGFGHSEADRGLDLYIAPPETLPGRSFRAQASSCATWCLLYSLSFAASFPGAAEGLGQHQRHTT